MIDLRRRDPTLAGSAILRRCIYDPGALAVVLFRVAQFFYAKRVLWRLARLLARLNQLLTDFEGHLEADVGTGLFVPHSHDIVIGEGVIVGENVTLYNGVTLGARVIVGADSGHLEGRSRYPTIASDVVIFTGAKVLGAVRIGAHAVIGANAVVLKDVPERATAVGVPAKVLEGR